MLSFSPRIVTKELLAELSDRSKRVLVDRFGLGGGGQRRTLDAIGKEYGITRERIRQIENHGLGSVRDSDAYSKHTAAWIDLKKAIQALGGVVAEETILEEVPKSAAERTHVVFLLTVGHHFSDRREDNHFKVRWHVDEALAEQVESALADLYESIEPTQLIPEEELLSMFADILKKKEVRNRQLETMKRWLLISKRIGRNPLGEWGRTESPHVRIRNTRDFAYLTLKRHGSPMHFTEVSKGIRSLFDREAHAATTHNELIKDKRFVLVGRGLYALQEWGYQPGIVRDVIAGILKREGPLSRADIIDRVKRERYVKDATISVNLQTGEFTRLSDGRYTIEE